MKSFIVSELMVPLSEYATVSEDATLYEAVVALEKAQDEFDETRYRHRAILVFDKKGKVVGKISQHDVLQGLEPKYGDMGERIPVSRFGFSPKFLASMLEQFKLFDKPLDDICKKASEMKVKSFMTLPTEGEYIDQGASLDLAIHQLIMGHHQSLLVTGKNQIVGILRLTDVFKHICQRMKECNL